MKTNVIIDISNVTHVVRHTLFKKNDTFSKDLLIGAVIKSIVMNAKKFKADGILIAGDSKNVWRRDIYPEYKGHRKEVRDEYYHLVVESIIEIQEFFNNHTNIPYISIERAEADDVIAVACQTNEHANVVISSDKDFVQLIDHKTKLYSPTTKGERTTTDAQFDLFVKCIRGDMGDNITSAYPRVRTKVLEESWGDSYKMSNLLETKRKDGMVVKDVFERNQILIDLTKQPEDIRQEIIHTLSNINSSNYNYTNILRYFGDKGLKEVAKEIDHNVFKKTYIYDDK